MTINDHFDHLPTLEIFSLQNPNPLRGFGEKILLFSTSLENRTLRSKWYMNQADCMHLSGNIACQSWPIIAKFCTFKQLYWLNQVTTTLAVPARILRFFFTLRIFFLYKTQLHCEGLVRKVDMHQNANLYVRKILT